MKEILLPLALILCGTTPQSAADNTHETKLAAEMHAAITDVPGTTDMSHADPKSWGNLPLAIEVYGQSPVTVPPNTEALATSNLTQEAALARAMVSTGI